MKKLQLNKETVGRLQQAAPEGYPWSDRSDCCPDNQPIKAMGDPWSDRSDCCPDNQPIREAATNGFAAGEATL